MAGGAEIRERSMALLSRVAALLVSIASVGMFSLSAVAVEQQPPILFVHGAGDDASIWYTTFWRFETNGYDPRRLFAIDFINPNPARPQDYGKLHPGRSTTAEQLIELAAKVDEVKRQTGEDKLVLV